PPQTALHSPASSPDCYARSHSADPPQAPVHTAGSHPPSAQVARVPPRAQPAQSHLSDAIRDPSDNARQPPPPGPPITAPWPVRHGYQRHWDEGAAPPQTPEPH